MKKEHSGGFVPLSVAGKDATNLFITTHPCALAIIVPASPEQRLFMIGIIHENAPNLFLNGCSFGTITLRDLRVRGISLTETLKCRENVAIVSFQIARDN